MKKKIKLFCLPYAGASAFIYNKWVNKLNDEIQLVPYELSGHGLRYHEPHYTSFSEIITELESYIKQNVHYGDYYALFGHSMGGTIVYELTHHLLSQGFYKPEIVYISGKGPPGKKRRERLLHLLPDEEFKEEIFKLGNTPREILDDNVFEKYYLPTLRNDFRLLETYLFEKKKDILDCPIAILYGNTDERTADNILDWSKYTKQECYFFEFDGGHFFIHEHFESIIKILNRSLYRGG
ncbi:thioesterase II family protein [Paenibacillus tyrfis]|uniref:Thioesterase domain-containing protein n=1 Tax=Paenibacillus tyrfis TaxID=1501230 RepID=A0A081NTN7_9BACL|nr:alpha/beta fold hydrolase [Paenibacillus tyrfis]KEQ21810.1 hypothetical protein ET33_30845 [Paenibacillus tyrfis]